MTFLHDDRLPESAYEHPHPDDDDDPGGGPLPLFLTPMSDARFWATTATRNELRAFALASYEALGPHDQAAFLDFVLGAAS